MIIDTALNVNNKTGFIVGKNKICCHLTPEVINTNENQGDKTEVKWKSLSHVRLFATPWTIQSLEFSRTEYWSG